MNCAVTYSENDDDKIENVTTSSTKHFLPPIVSTTSLSPNKKVKAKLLDDEGDDDSNKYYDPKLSIFDMKRVEYEPAALSLIQRYLYLQNVQIDYKNDKKYIIMIYVLLYHFKNIDCPKKKIN